MVCFNCHGQTCMVELEEPGSHSQGRSWVVIGWGAGSSSGGSGKLFKSLLVRGGGGGGGGGGTVVSVVCSTGDSFEVYTCIFCPLRALAGSGSCCRSSHATFTVPVVIICSMVIVAAFPRSFRVGHLSSTSISLTLDIFFVLVLSESCCALLYLFETCQCSFSCVCPTPYWHI